MSSRCVDVSSAVTAVLRAAVRDEALYEEVGWGGGEVMAVERSWAISCPPFDWKRVGSMDGRQRHKSRLEKELDDFVHDLGVAPLGNLTDGCEWRRHWRRLN